MATKRTIEASSLKLGVNVGVDDYGEPVSKEKKVAAVSPAISDADALAVGNAVGELQVFAVNDVYRVDTCRLSAE